MASQFNYRWKPGTVNGFTPQGVDEFGQTVTAPNAPIPLQPVGMRGFETWRSPYVENIYNDRNQLVGTTDKVPAQVAPYMREDTPVDQQREALMEEYRRNQARIAEIDQQIKAAGGNIDELDRNLAANRAEIGDIGNAQLHLGRIETRKNSERDRAVNREKNKVAARKELNNAYIMMAEASPAARNAWQSAIDDMTADYEKTYGEKFTPVAIPTGKTGMDAPATNKQEFTDKMRNLRNEKGNLTDEGIRLLQADIDAMPKGDMRNECQTLLDAEKSQEKKTAGAAAERAKEKAAIEEASKKFSGWNMKNGESKTYTAGNGKTVTYTKVNGRLEFTCGKSKG